MSDVNKKRSADAFGYIYNKLLRQYGHHISDSRIKEGIKKQVNIVENSTIRTFRHILKCVGLKQLNEKIKEGIE